MDNRLDYKYELTILTPTYNRKSTIDRLYRSLINQSNHLFQWLIIDDGSTDGTDELIESFKKHEFDLQYVRKNNGGKHTALNYAHPFIKGEWVCIVDSDDYLTENAADEIVSAIRCYREYDNVKCLTFLRGKPDGSVC